MCLATCLKQLTICCQLGLEKVQESYGAIDAALRLEGLPGSREVARGLGFHPVLQFRFDLESKSCVQ